MRAFHNIPLGKILPAVFVALGLLCAGPAAPADEKKKPVKPPTKQTQVIRPETYKKMEAAQKEFDAKDYAGALSSLDGLKAGYDKLNDYEKATLWNLYAAVYYAKEDIKSAINAYTNVLKQPNLPDGIRNNSLYALAQLYFITEDYSKAIAVIKKWFSVVDEPQPDGYALIAQAYYQQQDYKSAEKAMLQALRIAKEREQQPKENWLALLRAVYYELKDYPRSAKVLEILVSLYPEKGSYWQQLGGMYGLMDRQTDQVKTLHVAYASGLLSNESDLLNLARLYMVQDAPYPAVQVIAKGFKAKTIKANTENLQLYAQALALAKEYEQQLPVLKKLSEETGEAKNYVYLGQALTELGRWNEASEAFRGALRGKDLKDAATVRIQLGTALYNAGKLNDAREVFASVPESSKHSTAAGNWVKFVTGEIQRKRALQGE